MRVSPLRVGFTLACAPLLALVCSGCLVVGHSSTGGWYIWPGSIVVTLLILFLMFGLRRR